MVQSALGCDVTTAELHCNDLMVAANDIIDIANSILPYVEDLGMSDLGEGSTSWFFLSPIGLV